VDKLDYLLPYQWFLLYSKGKGYRRSLPELTLSCLPGAYPPNLRRPGELLHACQTHKALSR
jgi:hypothetical protein